MLREISYRQFLEWIEFYALEPFGEERDDHRSAQIVQAIVNANRDLKYYPNPFKREDFLLGFGDYRPPEAPKQTVAQMTLYLDSWILANNAMIAAKERANG